MYVHTGKTFTATVVAVVLTLGGLAVLSSGSHKDAQAALAQTQQSAYTQSPEQAGPSNESSANATGTTGSSQPSYEDGYRTGYRDGHQDCTSGTNTAATVRRAYYPRRVRVAGARYYAQPRRGHSTRNMILTMAGPAAVGAGIGAIAHGGKGAGIGALLGGGGGALYYLFKHRHD